jgi:hypothetical protein
MSLETISAAEAHLVEGKKIILLIIIRIKIHITYISTYIMYIRIVTDLINALPGNSSVKTVQHAAIKECVFSVNPTDAPVDSLDSDHVICVYGRSMSVPRLCK